MIRSLLLALAALFCPATLLAAAPLEELVEHTELRLAIWDQNQLSMQHRLVSDYSARVPYVTVVVEVAADYWSVVRTGMAGGRPYDVMWMNAPLLPVYAGGGALLPVGDLAERDSLDLSPYPRTLIDLHTHDGVLYGLPKDFDTVGLYYNVGLFDAAGLDYPDDTWTWDDLKIAARALTTDDVWGFAASLSSQTVVYDLIGQNGGEVLSEDGMHVLYGTPEACAALQFLYSFHEEGVSPDQATLDETGAGTLFFNQRVAMTYAGSWMARFWADVDFPVNVAPLPAGRQRSNIVHGLSYVIAADTENPEDAWQLVKYLGSHEAHVTQSSTGAVISSRADTQQHWVDSFGDDLDAQVHLDELPYAKPFPVAPLPGWNYYAHQVLQDAFRGNLSFPEACTLAAEAGDAYLAENVTD